jgi:PAS domain S-box-containing protein
MSQALRILIIEDSPDDELLLRHVLKKGGYEVSCRVVDTPQAMRAALESEGPWDVITSDHSMPFFSAPAALALAKELCPETPFIIVSGEIDLNLAVSLMRDGAQDYIQKREMARVAPAIERELKEAQTRRERRQMEEALRESHAELHRIVDTLQDAYFMNGADGRLLRINSTAVRLFGYSSAAEMLGMRAVDLYADQADRAALFADLQATGSVRDWTCRGLRKDGSTFWVSMNAQLLRGKDGRVTGTEGVVRDISERKTAEEALGESEARYRALFENNYTVILVIDPQVGAIIDANHAACAYYGWSLAELRQKNIGEINVLTAVEVQDQMDLARAQKRNYFEFRHRLADGSIHDVEVYSGPIEYQGRSLLLSIVHDTGDRRKIEAALRESEANLKKAQRFARLGSWTWHIQQNRLEWSDEMFRLFGLDQATFSGSLPDVIARAIHPADREKVEQSNLAVMRDRNPVPLEYRVIWPDGSVHWIWAGGGEFILDEQGGPERLSGIAQDITDRKQAEEALRESEDKFKYVFDHAVSGISITQITGKMYVNQAFYAMLGYTMEEVAGLHWEDITPPDDRDSSRQAAESLLAGDQEVVRFTKRYIHKTGRLIWVDLGISLRRDAEGKPLYFVTTLTDITERKRGEDQIRALNAELESRVAERTAQLAAANRELETFTYSVSHDLRAPLRALEGFSAILQEDYAAALDENGRRCLERMVEASRRMDGLINDLLALARVGTVEVVRAPVDLSGLAENIAAELSAQSPHRQVDFEIARGMTANADRNLLEIALQNLLSNAFKFTAGRVSAQIQIGSLEGGCGPVFFVRDNGAGFDMAHADKLFQPFRRLHSEKEFPGTGIGLSIVRRVIQRHAGEIWAESAPDQGATFYFTLG